MPKSLSTKQPVQPNVPKFKRRNPFMGKYGPSALGYVTGVTLILAIIFTPITLFVIIPSSQQQDKASAECVAIGAKPFEVHNTVLCAMPDGTVVLPKTENK